MGDVSPLKELDDEIKARRSKLRAARKKKPDVVGCDWCGKTHAQIHDEQIRLKAEFYARSAA